MPHPLMNVSLKTLLTLDAATCALMGAGLVSASQPLGAMLNIPAPLLFWAGLVLLPTAAFMAISAVATPTRWAMAVIVLGNALWTLASLLAPAVGGFSPNPLGWVFLAGQAAAVAVLTKLEFDAMSCFTHEQVAAGRAGQRGA